jgi:plastocyanin
MRGLTLVFGLLAVGSIVGCASDGGDINQPSAPKLPANAVSIVVGAQAKGTQAFDPNPLTISLASSTGGTVRWFNDDHTNSSYDGNTAVVHNITADDDSFSSGPFEAGTTFEASFGAPGTYGYHCSIHPTMKGTVTVTP